jgi:hypothetical protein
MGLEKLVNSIVAPTPVAKPKQEKVRFAAALNGDGRKDKRLEGIGKMVDKNYVDWMQIVQDLMDVGFSPYPLSKALGMSDKWLTAFMHNNVRKVDYAIGVALLHLHEKYVVSMKDEDHE